ncbi:hypothetical protein Tco_0117192 [Tanacetum coccineum]
MANIRTCNKHNMIACVEKTAQNADFYQIIDFLTGCSINYSLLVDPDLIGPWLQQFWATASLQVINDHFRAKGCKSAWDAQGTPISKVLLILSAAILNVLLQYRTADFQGTDDPHDAASIPKSPNDYTPTDVSQTSGGDEGLLDVYALNREVRRLKKHTLSQAKQKSKILKAQSQAQEIVQFVQPVVKYQALLGRESKSLRQQKRRRRSKKKKCSSVNRGGIRIKNFVEEHKVQDRRFSTSFFDDTADQMLLLLIWERKSDETEEVNIEENEASNVKSGETEELDLENKLKVLLDRVLLLQRIPNFERGMQDLQATPSNSVMESEEQLKAAESSYKGKGYCLSGCRRGKKRFEELKKTKPKLLEGKPTSLAQERNQMMSFLKGQGYKNLQKLKYPQMKELYDKVQASIKDSFKDFVPMDSEKEREMLKERDVQRLSRKRKATITEAQPSKKPKLRSETIDELRNYLRVVDCEKNAQDKESLEGISMITELQVIDSPGMELSSSFTEQIITSGLLILYGRYCMF